MALPAQQTSSCHHQHDKSSPEKTPRCCLRDSGLAFAERNLGIASQPGLALSLPSVCAIPVLFGNQWQFRRAAVSTDSPPISLVISSLSVQRI
jgi:hypothetical protein